MNRWAKHRLAKVLAGLVIAGLAATWAVGKVLEQNEETHHARQEVGRMTEKIKTVCVGRFLIDMPEEAQVDLARASVGGFDISAFDESSEDFQARLAQREAEIKGKPDRLGGNKNLESVKEIKTENGLVGKIFVHSRTVNEGTAGNGLENEHFRYEGIAVEALMHGEGVSIDLGSDFYFPDRIEDLAKLVTQLVPNPRNQVPADSGFCLDHAYIRDPLRADQGEQITMFANLPSHPDIDFLLILAAGVNPDGDGLLKRGAASEDRLSMLEKLRVTRLRAEPREIRGLSGEELVRRVVEENDAQVYTFRWEVNGTKDDVFTPHLVFSMTTGQSNNGPVPTSMSEDAAFGLWDTVSASIRVRPAERQRANTVEEPVARIGTEAWAGDRCPQSGWWLCGEGGEGIGVLGGQRQYIRKGERMPQALLLLPQTLWDKLRGLQPSIESKSRTSWKLVDARARKRVPPPLPLAKAKAVAPTMAHVSFAMSATDDHQGPPVGSYSSTGLPCPATGWWRCEESHALDGTRWFAQGSLLPPATFAVAPGIFGHSSTAPQAIQRRSAWRLMRLADTADHDQLASDTDARASSELPPSSQQA